ncbi:MAG: o-succinylbenzoate synthase [Candidatus Marinimicrobia bacterium]|nr:o-succinylbenzoate synthase [Candidatus Neomarinimicrobiota bacterium]
MKALKTSGMTYTHREGVWVQLNYANFAGVGEASPLPGFSTETLKEVHYALEGFHQAIDGEDLDCEELFLLIGIHSQNTPSVRFALESAIYDILAKEAELPLAKYLNSNAASEIAVNGMTGIHLPGDGFTIMKVKVGFRNLFDEIENMEYLTQSFGKEIQFRLDCNGVFDLPKAIRFCKEMEKFNIDYIEQPLPAANLEDLAELTYHTEIPIAVDESITDFQSAEKIIDEQAADVFIIKPMITGGFTECKKIIELGRAENIRTVITSTLETNIGRSACVHLALANDISEACGLATGSLLNEGKPTQPIQSGKISILDGNGLGVDL